MYVVQAWLTTVQVPLSSSMLVTKQFALLLR